LIAGQKWAVTAYKKIRGNNASIEILLKRASFVGKTIYQSTKTFKAAPSITLQI